MSLLDDDSHYFFVLHQIEIDLDIFHDELLEAPRERLDVWLDEWFKRRSNVTGNQRKPSEEFREKVWNWKEVERELEES
jgi:hypothetical protein